MPRRKDPNKKVQLTVRIHPILQERMLRAIEEDDRFDNRSDFVGQAVEAILDGPIIQTVAKAG